MQSAAAVTPENWLHNTKEHNMPKQVELLHSVPFTYTLLFGECLFSFNTIISFNQTEVPSLSPGANQLIQGWKVPHGGQEKTRPMHWLHVSFDALFFCERVDSLFGSNIPTVKP